MSLIVHIDTSLENAFVCLANNGVIVKTVTNSVQKEHASFVHEAIQQMIQSQLFKWSDVSAIAVTEGPGSYTGLRVGMSSAKGLCYALDLPLIVISTLDMIAADLIDAQGKDETGERLYCPLIDARRMEVFTALYNHQLDMVEPPQAKILDAHSYETMLSQQKIVFGGSGAAKFEKVCPYPNAIFTNTINLPAAMCRLAIQKLTNNDFTALAVSQPFYLKEHQTVSSSSTRS
jgi:tRNA threonylcarbamoyladenosine biosynthesis protein TsaB